MSVKAAPSSLDAEQHLLSIILLDGISSMSACMSPPLEITAPMFYTPANRVIYGRLMAMVAEQKPIDLASLAEELTAAKELDTVGGFAYLTEMSGRTTTSAQFNYFGQRVRELYTLREVIRQAAIITEKCYDYTTGGVLAALNQPLNQLLQVAAGGSGAGEESWDDIIAEASEMADSIITKQGIPPERLIYFPFDDMNELFGPMERGSLVILAARPSIGKSSLARQITCDAAKKGQFVYYTTYEVKPARVVLNMASEMTRIGIKLLGSAHRNDQRDFKAAIQSLSRYGIYMSRVDRTIARLVARAKAMHARRPISLIVVDHGGLLDDIAECPPQEKEAMIGYLTKQLKKLAGDLDCVVLLLWQLRRLKEGEKNREPDYGDLKGSGDLEADADKILLIHRPDSKRDQTNQKGHIHVTDLPCYEQNIIQAKGRDDGVATVTLEFNRAIASFQPIRDPDGEPPVQTDDLPF